MTISDTVSPEFEIVPGSYDHNIPKPQVTGNSLVWSITELKSKELTFTYKVKKKDSTKTGKYSLGETETTFEDAKKNVYSLNTVSPLIEVRNPEPVIETIIKNKGLITGGETVSITGKNFSPNVKVFFGKYQAAVLSENTDEILVTTPIGSQGPTIVNVINNDGQKALGDFNYYAEPTLSYITPSEGKLEGGNKIAVIGSHFMRGAKVFINDIEADTEFSTTSKLYSIVPGSEISGPANVKVLNPDGTEIEKNAAYTYLDPPPIQIVQLDSLSISSGKLVGGDSVYLIGKNFDTNAKVFFGDIEAEITYFPSSSKIRVLTPASINPGTITIKVINPDNTSSELINGYEYLPAIPETKVQLNSISASSGKLAGGESIYLFGTNFNRSIKIYFGSKEAPVNYYANTGKIRVTVPEGINVGLVSIKAENPDGSISELANGYEYLAPSLPPSPVIDYLSDASALAGEQKTIYLFGERISPSAKVYIGNDEAEVDFVTTSKIRIHIPVSNQPLVADVKLVNPDGQSTILNGGFTYNEPVIDPAPVITSLSSNSGVISGNESITIRGQNFKKGLKIFFGDRTATISKLTNTELVVNTPVSPVTGLVSVSVKNPDSQEFVLLQGYNYEPLPISLTSLSATSGPVKGGNLVYIFGTNFNNQITVSINGQIVPYTYLATNRIRIKMPATSLSETVIITVNRAGVEASIEYLYN